MKKIAMIFLLLTLSVTVHAQQDYPRDISYCWTLPTQYVDGTDIQPGDLGNIRIVTSRNDGTSVLDELVPITTELPGEQMCKTFVDSIPQPGTYLGVAYAITIDAISSDPSNESSKKYTGKPLPPNTFSN